MTDLTKAAREALEACETALRQFTKTPSTLADSTARGNAHAALATLSAALSEAPGEEREAFEAWWAGLCPAPYYPGIEKEIARNAWQARAMLAARPSAPTVALTEERSDCRACCGKGWNDEWRRVPGHYLGGEEFRIHCDECGGTGKEGGA